MKSGFLIVGGLVAGLSISNAIAGPMRVLVVPHDERQETGRCAKALIDTVGMISDEKIEAKVMSYGEYDALTKQEDAGWQNKKSRAIVVELDQRPDDSALHGIPFAFTDAAHFLAYLQSPLPARLDFNRSLGRETILAYGGFSQLFSRIAAVTTPKHFYSRRISGDAQGLLVYHEFGGDMGITLPGIMTADLPESFQRMQSGHALYDIVEAPLAAAYDADASHIARFLSLSSTSVESIAFEAQGDLLYYSKEKVSAWQRAAALRCSKENFATELEILEKFKKDGVQVAPFDRVSLVETSRRLWLEKPHSEWTIADFDELASLAAPIGKSPSQIVASLPAKRKAAALRFDDEARKQHAKVLESREPRGSAIDDVLRQYQARLFTDVGSLPLPSPPDGKPDRPKVLWKWWSSSNYDQVTKLTSSLEEAIRNCAKCDPNSLVTAWKILARADFALGKTAEATATLDKLFAAIKPTDHGYREVIRTAASIKDARARASILDLCDKVAATASTNIKKFPFYDLVSCIYLLSDIDEDDKARNAAKLAGSYASAHSGENDFSFLAGAQWYVGDLEGSRQSLILAVRLTEHWSWPLLRVSGPASIEANRPFAKIVDTYFQNVSDALYPLLANSPPGKRGRYEEWARYLGDAVGIERDYGMKDQMARNLQKFQDVAKGLQGKEREEVDDHFKYYLDSTGYLDDPGMTSNDPEKRLDAVGSAVAHFANFSEYLN
jgi:hypothetical protein